MPNIIRTGDCRATPEVIWAACCFEEFKWEIWDPDLDHISDVNGVLAEGTTFKFKMKDGGKIPFELTAVQKYRTITGKASIISECIFAILQDIKLEPKDAQTTSITYQFSTHGIAAPIVAPLYSSVMVGGVEKGLAKMIELGESAALRGQYL
ncbi:hypothetical protein CYMTET_3192 [Cymbomonas tetramitiformis]|uniref:SRPBCC family protein n=1 Tax=Cymbomonas tetramitiformis TaxID=36881 RepID=A0AAE0H3P0_9CHLO|nr:hypothetical protein CYMTET_37888 [Cymbomonas tetramitiformis]KAK3289373.1 hypothetical protein CYMTET_3192 [Cymbomonas tetramitiformis]